MSSGDKKSSAVAAFEIALKTFFVILLIVYIGQLKSPLRLPYISGSCDS